MTVLYCPIRHTVFTDEPVFPLQFADRTAVEMGTGLADLQAIVAGVTAVHHEQDGMCAEDALTWPCTTAKLLEPRLHCEVAW